MKEMIRDASEGMRAALHDVLTDAEELLESMGNEGADKYASAVTRLQRNVRRARDELGDYQETMARRARRAVRMADEMAHEHPWETAAVAAAIGAAIGALVAILLTKK
jgi:ElaB/YqjD/DUF883 family membrane-anchored ribosome-binding protein